MAKKKPKYGGAEFSDYAQRIVDHPNYAGMPDPIGERGEIQWEAPSNRQSGKFRDTHHRRREWWRQKAISLGINPTSDSTWISKTAKMIHPFGSKPCKTCGKELQIAYCYPNQHLFKRLQKLPYIDDTFELSEVEHICDLLARMEERFGQQVFADFPKVLATTSIRIPSLANSLGAWQTYLVASYIPHEPRMLSPGAMANPPDRLDGFHSFNRCCRATADTGRTKENLKTYVTDRRVFEYWVDGDWVAADRLMGQVRSNPVFEKQDCFNAPHGGVHPAPCQADHIGPISLGFTHRPQFQLLCKICNSGKNNRMYATDIGLLMKAEASGEKVISWFATEIWNLRKNSATDTETALRLSKLLRDNRHTYMSLLKVILDGKHLTFLASLLHLEAADFDPEFIGLRAENHLTTFDQLVRSPRITKYAVEQKARRIRIAFSSLADYHRKENRSAYVIASAAVDDEIRRGITELQSIRSVTADLDKQIDAILHDESISEEDLRALVSTLPQVLKTQGMLFASVRSHFEKAMTEVGKELDQMWDADRYVRSAPGEVIE
jgi:Alw26I/Eco31I/Esp3I family type II restriction endonuclease